MDRVVIQKAFSSLSKEKVRIDKSSGVRWMIFDSLSDIMDHKKVIAELVSKNSQAGHLSNVKFLVKNGNKVELEEKQECKSYTSIRIDRNHMIMVKNASLEDVRAVLLADDAKYQYKVSFCTSEYHGYMKFCNMETGKEAMIGIANYPLDSLFAAKSVRNEAKYHQKHFKGNIMISEGVENPKSDKGSSCIDFLITQKQFNDARQFLHMQYEHWRNGYQKSLIEGTPKNIQEAVGRYFSGHLPYNILMSNCHCDQADVFRVMGFQGNFGEYVPADYYDLKDKGLLYDLYQTHGLVRVGTHNFRKLASIAIEKIPMQPVEQVLKKQFIAWNEPKDKAYALHLKLEVSDTKGAIAMLKEGVDPCYTNTKGEHAFHLAAKLRPSNDKMEIIDELCTRYPSRINDQDLYGEHTPLSFAVMADDPDAIKKMIAHGADVKFVNETNDNLANIAASYNARNAAKALSEIAPELFYHDNGTKQLPLYILQEVVPAELSEYAPPIKQHDELHLITDPSVLDDL